MTFIKKRKYVRKNIKLNGGAGNSNRYPNADIFIPETLNNLDLKAKEKLLNEKYIPILDNARNFKKEIEENFNREQQILENKRLSDDKLKSFNDIERAKLSRNVWSDRMRNLGAMIWYLTYVLRLLVTSIYTVLLNIWNYVILPIIYGIFRILDKIFKIFLKFLEYFGFTFKEFVIYITSAFVYILNSIAGFFKNFKSTLFERGPFAHLFVTCLFIALIFGIVGAMSLASDDYNNIASNESQKTNGDSDLSGASSNPDSNTGDQRGEEAQKYLENEEWSTINFSDFMNDPIKTLSKFFSNLPFTIINSIFPPHIRNNVNSNIRMLYNLVSAPMGAPKIEDSKKITRGEIEGRPDNIYNVEIKHFNNINKLEYIKAIPSGNVCSIGKPKDIKWEFPENYYKSEKYDYSKLPNSIINRGECSSSNVTYNNKKTLIIPWELDSTGAYNIKCDDIKYYNGGSNLIGEVNKNINANILLDEVIQTEHKCIIRANDPISFINKCQTIKVT